MKTYPIAGYPITEFETWQDGETRVILEISDRENGWNARLVAQNGKGWYTTGWWTPKAHEIALEVDGVWYGYFWEYWEGFFPIGKLVKMTEVPRRR